MKKKSIDEVKACQQLDALGDISSLKLLLIVLSLIVSSISGVNFALIDIFLVGCIVYLELKSRDKAAKVMDYLNLGHEKVDSQNQ